MIYFLAIKLDYFWAKNTAKSNISGCCVSLTKWNNLWSLNVKHLNCRLFDRYEHSSLLVTIVNLVKLSFITAVRRMNI